ncbi:hypothetical protein ACFV6Y_38725 [Streptomyces massasporeus]|uniref:hypothetical protein n=1 Tax=Streptomyces massasporeus TaxID=67324 RepID=UPI00364FD468
MPETITAELTAREAAFLAKLTGRMSPNDVETAVPGYSAESNRIYACLEGDLFNRYYEDGVNDALRELS